MLLKSIKLENFRQYRTTFLEFAQDIHNRNVTIILGDNGSGKTTFLQSFFWCLYGTTNFKDQTVLNKTVASNMIPGDPKEVSVELKLQHGENEYTITRKQKFRKDNFNKVKIDGNSIFQIAKKDNTGNTTFVEAGKREAVINSILRSELSHYFFFDGERIETMGKEISSYKKTEEFAKAVEGILGLKGFQKALEHLNKNKKNSVIGKYNQLYDTSSDIELRKLTEIINACDNKINKLENRTHELNEEKDKAREMISKKREELKEYESSKQLQEEKEKLEKEIEQQKIHKIEAQKDICREFNNQMSSFLSISLIKSAFDILVKLKLSGSDIPSISDKTIQYLLEHKKCLCGTSLQEGTVEIENIRKLFDVLPPKSIGSMVNDFKIIARNRLNAYENFISFRNEKLSQISKFDEEIVNNEDYIHNNIDSKLNGRDVEDIVKTISNKIVDCEWVIEKNDQEIQQNAQEIGSEREKRNTTEQKRKELSLKNDANRKIEVYKEYANQVYEILSQKYSEKEAEVRKQLENNINEIFSKINNGDLTVHINEKYQIDVIANNIEDRVETSEGQSISVIFSFITSMIKMSRENRLSSDSETKLFSSDVYPLVMDAPLSKFDKKHIQSVCKIIPCLTEQVIIFIKDTEGDLAKEYMSDKIGKSFKFNKISETETEVEVHNV